MPSMNSRLPRALVAADRLEQLFGQRVEQMLQGWLPDHLDEALVDEALQLDADLRGFLHQSGRRLVEAEVDPVLAPPRPLDQEREAEHRLAGAGRPQQRRGRARWQAAGEHPVQLGHPERHADALLGRLTRRLVELDLGPRVHDHAAAGDLDLVPSAEVAPTAELVHDQFAHRPGPDQIVG